MYFFIQLLKYVGTGYKMFIQKSDYNFEQANIFFAWVDSRRIVNQCVIHIFDF